MYVGLCLVTPSRGLPSHFTCLYMTLLLGYSTATHNVSSSTISSSMAPRWDNTPRRAQGRSSSCCPSSLTFPRRSVYSSSYVYHVVVSSSSMRLLGATLTPTSFVSHPRRCTYKDKRQVLTVHVHVHVVTNCR
jgi:hypothetical protein